jgi:hypothetical protein
MAHQRMQALYAVWHPPGRNTRNLIDNADGFAGVDIRLMSQPVGLCCFGILRKALLVVSHATSSLKS